MRFVFYTEKTVAQCMAAMTERLHAKSSKGQLDGWVDKNGKFALSLDAPVLRGLRRRTVLTAHAERVNGVTVVRGDVPSGVAPNDQKLIYGALVLAALFLVGSGNILLSMFIVPAGILLYLPMQGDHDNHQALVGDVQRTLKAKTTPPKPAAPAAKATGTARAVSPARPAAKPATPTKPR